MQDEREWYFGEERPCAAYVQDFGETNQPLEGVVFHLCQTLLEKTPG